MNIHLVKTVSCKYVANGCLHIDLTRQHYVTRLLHKLNNEHLQICDGKKVFFFSIPQKTLLSELLNYLKSAPSIKSFFLLNSR